MVLLSFCLIFCQFQLGVSYKSVAYKKSGYLCKKLYRKIFFQKFGFTLCKAEQPLQGMKLKEKEEEKDEKYRKSPKKKICLLPQDLKPFRL